MADNKEPTVKINCDVNFTKDEMKKIITEAIQQEQSENLQEKIEQILREYLTEPCDWCVNVGMDGNCMDNLIPGETCKYDLTDDAIEDITHRITEEIKK